MKTNQITSAGMLSLTHAAAQRKTNGEFGSILRKELGKQEDVQFSKHAAQRVKERGICMNDDVMKSLNHAVQKAKEKGAKDVVIIGESGAFIVNVPHNIVVTTMSGSEMKENIFTNIDSAVIM